MLLLFAALEPIDASGTPTVALYFDRALTQRHTDCPDQPAGTVLDTFHVAVSGFSSPIEGIEFKIAYPPEVVWITDLHPDNGLLLGNTYNGLSMAFFEPLDASGSVLVLEVLVVWACEGCVTTDIPIEVTAHPLTGSLRAVTSDLVFEDAIGYTSLVCGTINDFDILGERETSPRAPASAMTEQCVLDCPAGDGGVVIPGDPPGQRHSPDLDNDGVVSIVDFAMFGEEYPTSFDPDWDFFCSGDIDLIDFVLFTRHWLHYAPVPVEASTWGSIKALYLD